LWFQLSLISECRARLERSLRSLDATSDGGSRRAMQLYAALGWSQMYTGGSTRETVVALEAHGANLVAAASIIDRSSGKAEVGVPRIALATLDVPSVDPAVCEACKQGEPAIKPGSRKKQ